MCSKPRLFITSTMKSEPGRSMVTASSTTAAGAGAGLARIGALAFLDAGAGCCARAVRGLEATRAALAAAVFKKCRRSTGFDLDFLAMEAHLSALSNDVYDGRDFILQAAMASISLYLVSYGDVFALIRPFSWGFALAGLRFARANFSQ